MEPTAEKELRERTSDLVLDWHTGGDPAAMESPDAATWAALIEAAHVAADEADHALHSWVDAGRRAGLTWTDVGGAVGTSRQAAQQRFAHDARLGEAHVDDEGRVVRTGVTAFNEVEILREEGRNGRRVLGATWFTLYFTQTEEPWDNIRVVSLRGRSLVEEYEGRGWSLAFTWFPYRYFTRPAG